MRDAVIEQVYREMQKDHQVFLITADLGFGIFDHIKKDFPKQFMNVGVAEQNMAGVACGMALEGYKVIIYSIANFPTLRCLEQIRNDACYHDANVTILSSGGGFSYGSLGMSHHATEDLSILRALPNVTVTAPCSANEAQKTLTKLLNTPGVGYLRIDKSQISESQDLATPVIATGKARLFAEGRDVALISTGGILVEVLDAAKSLLDHHSIQAKVLHLSFIKPIDETSILEATQNTYGVITIEENTIMGGLGSAVAEICLESNNRPVFFKRIGLNDCYSSIVGSQNYLRKYYNMGSQAILETTIKLMKEHNKTLPISSIT